MDPYAMLARAIAKREQVVATYNGLVREFCPHALGKKGRRLHVLGYQFGGASADGQPLPSGWRCFDVDRFEHLAVRPGPWHSAANVFNPQSCLDVVEAAVQAFPTRQAATDDGAIVDETETSDASPGTPE
jgi:hypothetical protein